MLFVLAGTIAAMVIGLKALEDGADAFLPEVGLTLVLVASVIGLLAALALMMSVVGLLGLKDGAQALGLPAGSVQAVIALSLILIFAIVSVHLQGQAVGEVRVSTGLTAKELANIPPSEIVEQDRVVSGDQVSFDVSRVTNDEDANDLRTQLLTTISTLVVAVAGFYFGSKTVTEGAKSVSDAAASASGDTGGGKDGTGGGKGGTGGGTGGTGGGTGGTGGDTGGTGGDTGGAGGTGVDSGGTGGGAGESAQSGSEENRPAPA